MTDKLNKVVEETPNLVKIFHHDWNNFIDWGFDWGKEIEH